MYLIRGNEEKRGLARDDPGEGFGGRDVWEPPVAFRAQTKPRVEA